MPPCTNPSFFRPLPMEYDKDDEDLYHDFRKCLFMGRVKKGTYTFRSKKTGDHMTFEVGRSGNYKRSYGVINGTPIKIEV